MDKGEGTHTCIASAASSVMPSVHSSRMRRNLHQSIGVIVWSTLLQVIYFLTQENFDIDINKGRDKVQRSMFTIKAAIQGSWIWTSRYL